MIFKSFNLNLIVRLLLLSAASLLTGFALYNRNAYWLIPGFSVMLIVGANLIYFVNGINRKIAFFFDAVRNDDTSLHFPEKLPAGSVKFLHQNLNQLNQHLTEIRLKNENNEKFFMEMMKYSATGLLAIDEEGYFEQVNDAALVFIGLPHITHLDLLKQKRKELYEVMIRIKPGQSKIIKLLHDQELRLLSMKVSFLNFGERHYRLYSLADIRSELEENELDSWQKLIRVMTHEIMNSIAPITSLSNTLTRIFVRNERPVPAAEITDQQIANTLYGLDVIENTGRGLMRFVEDYRKLTKIPRPVFKTIQIHAWMKSLHLLMKSCFDEEGIEFSVLIKGDARELIGDEKLLNQLMINLFNNSIDALKSVKNKVIEVKVAEQASGKISLSISDNGSGITSSNLERIFIPFFTTKENGSGIGLSLSRRIMRLHKGTISVFSKPGVRTTFTLQF
jgi:two-component system nitrogen regulation sensor histidine kinase NtrY